MEANKREVGSPSLGKQHTMQRENYKQLCVGDLVEIRTSQPGFCLRWQAEVKAWLYGPASESTAELLVKGYMLPELRFCQSPFDLHAQLAEINSAYMPEFCYGSGAVDLRLHEYRGPLCNCCAKPLQEPKKAYRKGGHEIFSPWTCRTLGCSVAWWGNKGSYPADQKTRTARRLLLEELKRREMFVDGLNIGRLNEQEALAKLEEICKPKTFYSNPAPLGAVSILGIPANIVVGDTASSNYSSAVLDAGRRMLQSEAKPVPPAPAKKIIRDMDLD